MELKDLKEAFEEEKKEFDKKNKPKDWNENDQKKLDELISILKEENPNLEIGSEKYSIAKEKAFSFSKEKGKYASDLIREIMPMKYPNMYLNYMYLCGNITYEYQEKKETYEEAVMREQNEFKKSPEFKEEIKSISNCLGFGGKINFEGKLRETLLNKNDTDNFSIPIVLENKKTGDTASFNVKISYVIEENITKLRPTLFDYDLTLKKKNGKEKTMNFDFSNGKILNAKDAISFLEKEMELTKKEEIYAYLVDDYGFETDMSNKIRKITEEDIDRNKYFRKNEKAHTQFMVDIYGETNLKGTLVTNAFHVECNESSISGIEAPNAEVINCAYCDNIEEIKAPNCKDIYCEDSPLLKEDNMELHPDCYIDGLKETLQLKR